MRSTLTALPVCAGWIPAGTATLSLQRWGTAIVGGLPCDANMGFLRVMQVRLVVTCLETPANKRKGQHDAPCCCGQAAGGSLEEPPQPRAAYPRGRAKHLRALRAPFGCALLLSHLGVGTLDACVARIGKLRAIKPEVSVSGHVSLGV